MYRRWKPSKAKAAEFKETMDAVAEFCTANAIDHSASYDSFYFSVNGQEYRVSNHSIEASNAHAYNLNGEQIRSEYHPEGRQASVKYIHASKTRIIDIYQLLQAGHELDGNGRVK